jgi:hypothetical protein
MDSYAGVRPLSKRQAKESLFFPLVALINRYFNTSCFYKCSDSVLFLGPFLERYPRHHRNQYKIIVELSFQKVVVQIMQMKAFGGYEMVWRQLIWFHDCQCHQVWLRFANGKVPNFHPTAVKTLAWGGTNGPSGARITLQHHSSYPFGGYEMVWRQLIWFHDCQCHQVWLRFAGKVPNFHFHPTAVKTRMHGV